MWECVTDIVSLKCEALRKWFLLSQSFSWQKERILDYKTNQTNRKINKQKTKKKKEKEEKGQVGGMSGLGGLFKKWTFI